MGQIRVSLLAAIVATSFVAGCSFEGPTEQPNNLPPAPTAPVDANGQPLVSLCDLLSADDVNELVKVTATPPAPVDLTATSGTCEYAKGVTLTFEIGSSADDAMSRYQAVAAKQPFATVVKDGPIGGVQESVYGESGKTIGLALRRDKLVVALVLPEGVDQPEPVLIQLAGRLLSRANALGAGI